MDSNVNLRSVAATATSSTPRSENRTSGKTLPNTGEKLPEASAPPPTPDRVEQAVQQIQSYLNDTQRQLQFQVDSDSGRMIVRVINPETQELIRQMPSEEVLKLARALGTNGGLIISDLA